MRIVTTAATATARTITSFIKADMPPAVPTAGMTGEGVVL